MPDFESQFKKISVNISNSQRELEMLRDEIMHEAITRADEKHSIIIIDRTDEFLNSVKP